jgi:hypothetical protein
MYRFPLHDIIQICAASSDKDCRRLLPVELLFQVLPSNHEKFVSAGVG